MNIAAAGSIAIFLLEKGGLQSITDLRTIINMYNSVHTQKTTFADTLTTQNLDAIQRVMVVLTSCVQDANGKAQLVKLINSLQTDN